MVELLFYIDAKKDLNHFYKGFLDLIRSTFPPALPARYGLIEPPEYVLSEKGEEHFLDLLHKNRDIVWYGTFPVKYVLITDWRKNEPYYRYAHRPHKIAIWIDEKFYHQNESKRKANSFFIETSKFFDVTYAEINEQIDSDRFALLHNMTKKNFWQGEFSYMGNPCIIGKPYCEYAKKENGMIMNPSEELIYFEINTGDGMTAETVFEEAYYNLRKGNHKKKKPEFRKKPFFYQTLPICKIIKVMKKDNAEWSSEECMNYERWFHLNLESRPKYLLNYIEETPGCSVKKLYYSGDPECLTVIWKWFLDANPLKQNFIFRTKKRLSIKMELILMDIGFLWGNFLVQNSSELQWLKNEGKNDIDRNLIQIGKFAEIIPGKKQKFYHCIDPFRIMDILAERIIEEEQQVTDLKNEYFYWKERGHFT